jgi:hypothetical protein
MYSVQVLRVEERNLHQRLQELQWKLEEIPMIPDFIQNRGPIQHHIKLTNERIKEINEGIRKLEE